MRITGIPGPTGSSLSRLRAFHKNPLQLFLELTQEHGERVQFTMGPWNFLLLSRPEDVGLVLSRHLGNFVKGPGIEPTNPFIGRGLLTSEEEDWVRQRRALAPVFRNQNVRDMLPMVDSILHRLIDELPTGHPFNVEPHMLQMSLTLVLETLFETPVTSQDRLTEMRHDIQWIMGHFYRRSRSAWRFPYQIPVFNRRYHAKAARVRNALEAMRPERQPYEAALSHITTEKPAWYHEALTLIVAGHETTGHALAWALDLLGKHPEIAASVFEESQLNTPVTATTHPVTSAVWQETLRMYPPAWLLSRTPVEDFSLDESVVIPKGTIILISPWLCHRSPQVFPHPDTFRPERFLDGPSFPPYAYIPFGAGPRACIGEHLATAEALLALSRIIQQYEIHSSGPRGVFPGITLAALDPIWITLNRRTTVVP